MEAYEIMKEFLNEKIGLVLKNNSFSFENENATKQAEIITEIQNLEKNPKTQHLNISMKYLEKNSENSTKSIESAEESNCSNQGLENKISDLEKTIQNQKAKLLFLEDQMLNLQKQKTLEIREFFKKT